MTDRDGGSFARTFSLYSATVLIWGSTWLPLKIQTALIRPELSVLYRLALASMLLFVWCRVRGLNLSFSLKDHAFIALFGLLLFNLDLVLLYAASSYITSGLEAVVFSTIVVFNIVNGMLFLGRRPVPAVIAGAVLGLIGLCMTFWDDVRQFEFTSGSSRGVLICLGATLCASFGNIVSVRNQRAGIPVLQANAFGMWYASLFLLVYCAMRGVPFQFDFSFAYVSALVFLALFGSVIAFGAYLSLLTRVGPERAAYANLLFPVVALLVSTLFEQYQWNVRVFGAVCLILAGNALILVKPRPKVLANAEHSTPTSPR